MAISKKMMDKVAANKKRVERISKNFPHALKASQSEQSKEHNSSTALAR